MMITRKQENLKLVDFGSACMWKPGDPLIQGEVGSPFYAAPEVNFSAKKGYDHRSDVFSAGVACYVMVAGFPKDPQYFWSLILEGSDQLPILANQALSKEFWGFMAQVLVVDQTNRPEAYEILDAEGTWLTEQAGLSGIGNVLDSSKHGTRKEEKRLKKKVTFLLSSSLSAQDLVNLQETLETLTAPLKQKDQDTQYGKIRLKTRHLVTLESLAAALNCMDKQTVVDKMEVR